MKTVHLNRFFYGNDCTLGGLNITADDGGYNTANHEPIYTLELPWRDNQRRISCIPGGWYECQPFDGSRFKNVWQVMNVPGRTYILFHAGNRPRDIEGCILVGLKQGKLSGDRAVLHSRRAMDMMRDIIGRKPFTLNIT